MTNVSPRVDRFIAHLEELRDRGDRAALAALRRVLGKNPEAATEAHPYVLPFTAGLSEADEDAYYLVGSLFGLHAEGTRGVSLGTTLQRLRDSRPTGQESLERRFMALLDESSEGLAYHLRQLVSLLKAQGLPVDHRQLLNDLLAWNHPSRHVQYRWARDYFPARVDDDITAPVDNDTREVTS